MHSSDIIASNSALEYDIQSSPSNTQIIPLRQILSETSRQCLNELALYEIGLDVAEHTTIAIAKRLSTRDEESSVLLLKQVSTLL